MIEREVIVVGAGPTGSTAAIDLARRGRDVLLLDRQDFPRDKTCGDGIPAGVIEQLIDLGMEQLIQTAAFYPVWKLLIVSPSGHEVEADLEESESGAQSYIAPRLKFDALLQRHSIASGAEFRKAHVTGPIVEKDSVIGVRARLNGTHTDLLAKVVIAADGATSVIGRALLPQQYEDKHRGVALRAYIDGLDVRPHQVEVYLYKQILPGYAWIFPNGERQANIGLGMRLDKYRMQDQTLQEMLQIFLESPFVKERLKPGWQCRDVATWPLNFGSQNYLQRTFNGLLLAGDAAGFINPLSGGGIHNGVTSARYAADIVDKALSRGDTSCQIMGKAYEERCHQSIMADMRGSYFFQRSLVNFPFLIDWLIRWAGSNSSVTKIIMNNL